MHGKVDVVNENDDDDDDIFFCRLTTSQVVLFKIPPTDREIIFIYRYTIHDIQLIYDSSTGNIPRG
jgi:hypothetical protein